ALVQEPQPPPVVVQTKTMPQMMARLEEEVHWIRESLVEQQEVMDAMARDFSRFIVWAASGISQLLDATGATHTSSALCSIQLTKYIGIYIFPLSASNTTLMLSSEAARYITKASPLIEAVTIVVEVVPIDEPAENTANSKYSPHREEYVIHPGSVGAWIRGRICRTRGSSSKPPVKRKLVQGASTSRSTCAKAAASKDDSLFLTISDDDEGKLLSSHIICSVPLVEFHAFEEVANMKEPFDIMKVKGYRSSYKQEHTRAENDLATGTFPFLASIVADPHASIGALLYKNPCVLQRPSPIRTHVLASSIPSQKATPSPALMSPPSWITPAAASNANACHLKVFATTPLARKNNLDNQLDIKLLDLHDQCYARKAVVDNAVNKRSRDLLKVIDQIRSECDVLKDREKAGYKVSLLMLESKVDSLEAEKVKLEAVKASLRQELQNAKLDRAEVVSKVVPYVAMKLVNSDDMGRLVAKLVYASILYEQFHAFEEVANMKEPFDIMKVKGY
nr:hypothetical protein [Tanacetum cinerariifolium]